MRLVGLVLERIYEALLAVNQSPFPASGYATSLSKSSQLQGQLLYLHESILFLLPSSAPVSFIGD